MASPKEISGIGWALPAQSRMPRSFERSSSTQSIATETTPKLHPAWDKCVDSLLDEFIAAQSRDDSALPSQDSVAAALRWIVYLRKEMPDSPPTYIAPDPDGGIMIERRWTDEDGDSIIWEILLLNDDRAEATVFYNGEVVDTFNTSMSPH